MAKVEKHPSQDGKYMCPLCAYGSIKGKSRQSVYKHHNAVHKEEEIAAIVIEEQQDYFELPGEVEHSSEEQVFDEEWSTINWMQPGEEEEVIPHTIPDPIKKMLVIFRSRSPNFLVG